jgi:hypothetical protein
MERIRRIRNWKGRRRSTGSEKGSGDQKESRSGDQEAGWFIRKSVKGSGRGRGSGRVPRYKEEGQGIKHRVIRSFRGLDY